MDQQVLETSASTESDNHVDAQVSDPGTSVFRNRNFLLLWIAQALSQTAQNAIWYGLLVAVEESTHSTTQLSLVVLTSVLPSVLFGMIAGVYVDRLNKKAVLVVTNGLRAIAVLGFLLYPTAVYLVFVINFLFCSISQFFAPAEVATIPQLVPKRQLMTANSAFNITFTASQLAGLVLLGPLVIKMLGVQTLFIGLAGVYLVCTILVSVLPRGEKTTLTVQEARSGTGFKQIWSEIRESWGFIRSDSKTVTAMANLTLMSILMLMMAMLAPRFVVTVLNIRADDSVFVLAPAGVGVFLGTSLLSRLSSRFGKLKLVVGGLALFGAALFLMGASEPIVTWLLTTFGGSVPTDGGVTLGLTAGTMILAVFMGLAFAFVTVPSQTMMMEQAPASTRGRVFAVQQMLGNVVSILPVVGIGGLADVFGVRQMIAFLGAVTIGFAWLTSRYNNGKGSQASAK